MLQLIRKLRDFIHEQAIGCVHDPAGHLERQFATPTYGIQPGSDDHAAEPERSRVGHYHQMYDWDACFFALAMKQKFPHLALDTVTNFLNLQNTDGYVPRSISPMRLWDLGDLCKPFLCQTLTGDIPYGGSLSALSDQMICRLRNHLDYYDRHRKGGISLYRWRNVLESGVDNNLAVLSPRPAAKDENKDNGRFPENDLLAVDLSCYLCCEFRALAQILDHNGNKDLADVYRKRASSIVEAIDYVFWDEQRSMYFNCHTESSTLKVLIRSWTGLLPVLLGIARQDRTQQIIENNILDPEHFLRPGGIASMARSEKLYNNAVRGLYGRAVVSNWQGPVWTLPNVLAVRCLMKHGYERAAMDICQRVLKTLADGLASHGTLFENYNAETGEPLWAPHFLGWNSLALELIELIDS